MLLACYHFFFFFNDTATTEIYTLSLHDALPILHLPDLPTPIASRACAAGTLERSEEHTSELQSRLHLVCRLLLEKKKPTRGALTPTSSSSETVRLSRACGPP